MIRSIFENKFILVIFCLLCALVVIFFGYEIRKSNTLDKVQQTKFNMLRVQMALDSHSVDHSEGCLPFPGNYLSPQLTTPVGYLTLPYYPPGVTGEGMVWDLFSSRKEPIKIVGQRYMDFDNYILVSQGPDKDWDIDRFSSRTVIYGPIWLRNAIQIKYSGNTVQFYPKGSNYSWAPDVEYCVYMNGERVDNPARSYMTLAEDTINQYKQYTWTELLDRLSKDTIVAYDPTNGVYSNGDIIWLPYTSTTNP